MRVFNAKVAERAKRVNAVGTEGAERSGPPDLPTTRRGALGFGQTGFPSAPSPVRTGEAALGEGASASKARSSDLLIC